MYHIQHCCELNNLLTKFHKLNVFSSTILQQKSFFHLKVKIDLKFYAINIFSIIARNKNAREIIINEIVALIFIAEIFNKIVELFLILCYDYDCQRL